LLIHYESTVLNKPFIKIGISVVLAGAGTTGFGILVMMGHYGCMELARACGDAEPSGPCPVCPENDSFKYLLGGLPVTGVGIAIMVLAAKDAQSLRRVA
jgi:hypothetical protein